ncbi:hypothetical protein D9756_011380 [Leucocoprinus leucothites]|uniref:Uncharacterized protein n=1 Tax=Leucocoprinus leucothites TaxID=201217 RepID=A0A8H5CR25_9AGAR|nr:hypothetical protein D9756_011380 [Leucoagaricus leucothites]
MTSPLTRPTLATNLPLLIFVSLAVMPMLSFPRINKPSLAASRYTALTWGTQLEGRLIFSFTAPLVAFLKHEMFVSTREDGQDDENPGLLVKGKVDGDEDNSEGNISATADSIDSKQPATDASSPDASEESDYETANEADDPELRHVLQSTPIRSTRSTTRTATRVDKGTSYSSSPTSKAPARAPNASAKAGSIAK